MIKIKRVISLIFGFFLVSHAVLAQEHSYSSRRKIAVRVATPVGMRNNVRMLTSEDLAKYLYVRARIKCLNNIFNDQVSRDSVYVYENNALKKLSSHIVNDDATHYEVFLKQIEPGYQDTLKENIREKIFQLSGENRIPTQCLVTSTDSLIGAYRKLILMRSHCVKNI